MICIAFEGPSLNARPLSLSKVAALRPGAGLCASDSRNLASTYACCRWLGRGLLYVMAVVALANAFQFLVRYQVAFLSGIENLDADLLKTGFSNPRFLNQFQALLMPLLAYLASYHWRARHRYANTLSVVLLLVLAVQWCIAFTLGGRGLFAGLLVAHVALLVLFPRYWRLLAWQLGAALLGLLLFVLLFVVIPELLNVTPHLRDAFREGLSGRNVIWALAWKLFVAHPGLGVGPLMFAAHVNPVAAHPHQVVLQWLAEWGLVATAMAIVLAAWGMWRGLTIVRHDASRPLDAALWLSIACALVLAQVDGVFVMPYTQTWLAVLVGIAMGRWRHGRLPDAGDDAADNVTDSACRRGCVQRWGIRLLALSVALIFAQQLIQQVPQLSQLEASSKALHAPDNTPRYWSQGWLPMQAHSPSSPGAKSSIQGGG